MATSRTILNRKAGRASLRFFKRSRIGSIPITKMSVAASLVQVSTIGATMLDVAEDLDVSGGLDNAATVISDLACENGGFLFDVLVAAPAHSATAVRRLGWILENVAGMDGLDDLVDVAMGEEKSPSYLSPTSSKMGHLDSRWNIILNKEIDLDI